MTRALTKDQIRKLYETVAQLKAAHVVAARRASAAFTSYVMRDEAGQPLKLADFHHEWHKLLALHDQLIIWGSAEIGKCEAAGARIALADGRHERIERLCGQRVRIQLLDPKGMDLRTADAAVSDNGLRRVHHIRLKSGRRLTLTDEHPLYTPNEWRKAKELRVGDFVATARQIAEPAEPSALTGDEAELLGFLFGDGGCSTQSRVCFTKADPGVVDRVSAVAGTFGWSLTPLEADPITHRITRVGAYEGKASPSAFVRRFNMDKKSIEKVVPPEVFQARDTVLARFIGAYFSCDGSVNLPIGQAPRLELASSSPGVAEDFQLLLLRFEGLTPGARTRRDLDSVATEHYLQAMMAAALRPGTDVGRWSHHELVVRDLQHRDDAGLQGLVTALFAQSLRGERFGIPRQDPALRIAVVRVHAQEVPVGMLVRRMGKALDDAPKARRVDIEPWED